MDWDWSDIYTDGEHECDEFQRAMARIEEDEDDKERRLREATLRAQAQAVQNA